ncbi:MAG: hydrogenase small subunit [Candidatus Omnitrophota bacterium]
MKLTRRQFIKIFGSTAVGAGITGFYNQTIIDALAVDDGKPPVLWLQGASCNGCSVSLLNTVHPKIAEVLLHVVSMRYHQTLMAATGKTAFDVIYDVAEEFKGKYILVLEGGIPTAENGAYCTIGENYGHQVNLTQAIDKLAPDAAGLIAVGTCAAFGGIPSGKPNPANVKGLSGYTGKSIVNVSGCPAHPDWVVGTLIHLLHFGVPELDEHGRPLLFYGKNLHENCPNYSFFANGKYAEKLGEEGCLAAVGCKGPMAFADCPLRHWNSGVNWCIGSGTGCIACCEPGFPDSSSGMYEKLPDDLIPRGIV